MWFCKMVLRRFLSVDITSSNTNKQALNLGFILKIWWNTTANKLQELTYFITVKTKYDFYFFAPQRICLENNSLLKAALTGARIVYSVFGRIAAARPTSDTMLLNFIWESPISSRPSLADNHTIVTCYSLLLNIMKLKGLSLCAHLRQGWGPVWSGGWCRWWWRCPSSAPSWCRWLSGCRRHSQSLWCCPRRSQTPTPPWWLRNTGRCLTGGSWPGLGETDRFRLLEWGNLNCVLFILSHLDTGLPSYFAN